MNLRVIGCNFRTAPVDLREKLALDPAVASLELAARYGCEAAVLNTCNRVEIYVAESTFEASQAAAYFANRSAMNPDAIEPLLYCLDDNAAVAHLFRVAASLDSLVLGEGQIAGQVKQTFETAKLLGTAGPMLHSLFPQALRSAKRVRTETGIARGHASVSSVAVDYVKQVFDRFDDKVILIIGAGKMARLTLRHLRELTPKQILVVNRSPGKATEVAAECGGRVVPWAELDKALVTADIALSTTGADEPIMTRERFSGRIQPKRTGTLVVLDIAVPRDFDPSIHDGDRVCIFNIDDLLKVRETTLTERRRYLEPAEMIVAQEVMKFIEDWNRRKNGPVIQQLKSETDKLREAVIGPLLAKMNGRLTEDEKAYIAGAFQLFQNRLLHGPIAALHDASRDGHNHTLLDSLKKLFRLSSDP